MSEVAVRKMLVRVHWLSRDYSVEAVERRVAEALEREVGDHFRLGHLPSGEVAEIISFEEQSRNYFGGGPGEVPHQIDTAYHVKYKLRGE